MIIQGSNNPLVFQFDADVSTIPTMVVSLWSDLPGYANKPLKIWWTEDMLINGDTAICDITENETRNLPSSKVIIAIKGWDENGITAFWEELPIDINTRHDKNIIRAGRRL